MFAANGPKKPEIVVTMRINRFLAGENAEYGGPPGTALPAAAMRQEGGLEGGPSGFSFSCTTAGDTSCCGVFCSPTEDAERVKLSGSFSKEFSDESKDLAAILRMSRGELLLIEGKQ